MKISRSLLALILLLTLSFIYGSSYLLMKRGLVALTPIELITVRLTVPGILLLLPGIYYLRSLPRKLWLIMLVFGLCSTAVTGFLFALAQTRVDSALAGTLNSVTPLWVLVWGWTVYGNKPAIEKVYGIVTGMIGVVVLLAFGKTGMVTTGNFYGAFILLAGLGYAISMYLIQYQLKGYTPLAMVSMSYVMLLPGMILGLSFTSIPEILLAWDQRMESVAWVLLLGLIANTIGFLLFARLVQIKDPSYAATIHLLIPIVATSWGWLDGENLGWNQVGGMALILLGVFLANRSPATSSTKLKPQTDQI